MRMLSGCRGGAGQQLVQTEAQAWEENPDGNMTVNKFVEEVQNILYAKDPSSIRSEQLATGALTRLNPCLKSLSLSLRGRRNWRRS